MRNNTDGQLATSDELAMLIARCAGGDRGAFRRVYDTEAPLLYGVALRITRDPGRASDAVHDALLQLWRNAARFDPARGQARTWLVSLVRYRALDTIDRTAREVQDAGLPEQQDTDPDPLDRLLTTRAGQALRICLGEISPDRRGWVLLAFLDGLTHVEVADRVGQPLGTVKSGIRRALLSLRACLGGASE